MNENITCVMCVFITCVTICICFNINKEKNIKTSDIVKAYNDLFIEIATVHNLLKKILKEVKTTCGNQDNL